MLKEEYTLLQNEQGLVAERLHLRCCSQEESNVYCFGTLTDRCFVVSEKGEFMGTDCQIDADKKQLVSAFVLFFSDILLYHL